MCLEHKKPRHYSMYRKERLEIIIWKKLFCAVADRTKIPSNTNNSTAKEGLIQKNRTQKLTLSSLGVVANNWYMSIPTVVGAWNHANYRQLVIYTLIAVLLFFSFSFAHHSHKSQNKTHCKEVFTAPFQQLATLHSPKSRKKTFQQGTVPSQHKNNVGIL